MLDAEIQELSLFWMDNTRDFDFLVVMFDHSSYSKNLCKYKKRKIVLKVFWIIK
jgi:hypothetical protein